MKTKYKKRKKYNKRKTNKGIIIAATSILVVAGAGTVMVKKVADKEPEQITKVNTEPLGPGRDKIQYIGTSLKGKRYAYSAKKVAEKFAQSDFSNNGEKIVFLTFDDGASTTVTPEILKVLDQYDVKATFFVLGKSIEEGGEKTKALIKEQFEKGHAIANHSYSHDYKILYPGRSLNLDSFTQDFGKTDAVLKEILGQNFSTQVLRCPGGYSSWNNMEELKAYLDANNKVSIDWNSLSKDAEGRKKDAAQLLENVKITAGDQEIVVVLMHDTYGKEETARALPGVIEYFKSKGYSFKTLV